jgi:hypothetical protein
MISSYPFQTANSYRFFFLFEPPTAAGRLAGTITGTPQDARKNVGLPVDHIGLRILLSGNQPDVLRYRRMSRAGMLTINDFVEIFRVLNVRRFHNLPHFLFAYPCNIVSILKKDKD